MTDGKRVYRKRRRAEQEAQTALRITESAVELHGSLGPSRTSISAIARHAGVRRSTVYRYFPDEGALFMACTSHWRAANPAPDIARWEAIGEPAERLEAALGDLYAYYRQTEQMLENILRDEQTMPLVKEMFGAFREYLAAAQQTLVRGRRLRGGARRRVVAAIGHTLAFTTWRSLTREQALDDSEAAALMCRLVAAAERG